ncbi:MAG: hypothetical protein NTX65_13365 [Ignavibacteriales bacterium]|nr:hypothetical protein [Ignavibacteriales bacterium]
MNHKKDVSIDFEFKMNNKEMTKNNSTLLIHLVRISINEISEKIEK